MVGSSSYVWLQLLSKTLVTMDDSKWVCQLVAEATRYLSTYNNALEEKVRQWTSPIPTIPNLSVSYLFSIHLSE